MYYIQSGENLGTEKEAGQDPWGIFLTLGIDKKNQTKTPLSPWDF